MSTKLLSWMRLARLRGADRPLPTAGSDLTALLRDARPQLCVQPCSTSAPRGGVWHGVGLGAVPQVCGVGCRPGWWIV